MIDGMQSPWMILPDKLANLTPMGPRDRIAKKMSAEGRLDFSPPVSVVNGIATVEVTGTLTRRPDFWQAYFDGVSSELLAEKIESLAADESVDAIVLRIDSPGGEAAGMSEVAKSIKAAGQLKPIVSVVNELCASGAYYIASQTSAIYAGSETAVVGSIGTLMVLFDTSQLFKMAGVEAVVLATGQYKGTGAPGTPITDEQKAYLQGLVDDTQRLFAAAVQGGRGLTDKQINAVADGRVFHATDALKLKLIDGIQTYDQTITGLHSQLNKPKTGAKKMSQAATFVELKTCLPGASTDFLCEAQEKGWSLDQAQSTYMERQAARIAELEKENKSKDAAQAAAPVGINAGAVVEPISAVEPAGNAQEQWDEAINAEVKAGRTRQQAVINVSRKQPALRAQLLAAANSR